MTEAKRLIAQGASVNWQNDAGKSLLNFACRNTCTSSTNMVVLLIEHKANVNSNEWNDFGLPGENHVSPLISATYKDYLPTVRALVEAGADITYRYGTYTSADSARFLGHHTKAEYLLN